jgi:hypothetical protein
MLAMQAQHSFLSQLGVSILAWSILLVVESLDNDGGFGGSDMSRSFVGYVFESWDATAQRCDVLGAWAAGGYRDREYLLRDLLYSLVRADREGQVAIEVQTGGS